MNKSNDEGLLKVDQLLELSKAESEELDSQALQQRIIFETSKMSQADQTKLVDKLWHPLVNGFCLTPATGALSFLLVFALGWAVLSIQNRSLLSESVVHNESVGTEMGLLSEGLLDSQLSDGEVWQELILLDEELSFAML